MQCYHVLRSIDEITYTNMVFHLLKLNGYLMVVAGAVSDDGVVLTPGPPQLTEDDVTRPFLSCPFVSTNSTSNKNNSSSNSNNTMITSIDHNHDHLNDTKLVVISTFKTRFNNTSAYAALSQPPAAWVVVFKKILANSTCNNTSTIYR